MRRTGPGEPLRKISEPAQDGRAKRSTWARVGQPRRPRSAHLAPPLRWQSEGAHAKAHGHRVQKWITLRRRQQSCRECRVKGIARRRWYRQAAVDKKPQALDGLSPDQPAAALTLGHDDMAGCLFRTRPGARAHLRFGVARGKCSDTTHRSVCVSSLVQRARPVRSGWDETARAPRLLGRPQGSVGESTRSNVEKRASLTSVRERIDRQHQGRIAPLSQRIARPRPTRQDERGAGLTARTGFSPARYRRARSPAHAAALDRRHRHQRRQSACADPGTRRHTRRGNLAATEHISCPVA